MKKILLTLMIGILFIGFIIAPINLKEDGDTLLTTQTDLTKVIGDLNISYGNIVTDGDLYFQGNTNERMRFTVDPSTNMTEIERYSNEMWEAASFMVGLNSLWLGRTTALAALGHHVATESVDGHLHTLVHDEFNGNVTTEDAKVLYAYDFNEYVIFQPDNSSTWTGTNLNFSFPSSTHNLAKKIYYQTGSTAATSPILIQIWKGLNDSGTLVFKQRYHYSDFPADSNIFIETNGYIEYDSNETYFLKYTSEAAFSLKSDSTQTYPWFAADISSLRQDMLLQAAPWINNTSFPVGQIMINDRKIYVSNDSSVQIGTFESNSDKWGNIASQSVMNYWSKIGNDLYYDNGNAIITNGVISAYGPGGEGSNFVAGDSSGYNLITGAGNVLIGDAAGTHLTNEDDNTCIGEMACNSATGLYDAVGIGSWALTDADGANRTIAIGGNAGYGSSGINGVYLGYEAGKDNTIDNKLFISNDLRDLVEGDFDNQWLKIYGELEATKIGIGKSNVYGKLHIYENTATVGSDTGMMIEQDGEGDAVINFMLTANRLWSMGIDNSNVDSFNIAKNSNLSADTYLTIAGTTYGSVTEGNVGISTSNPQAKLDIMGSRTDGKSLQLRSGDGTGGTDSSQIILSYDGNSYDSGGYAHSIRTRHNGNIDEENAIDFWLWNNDTANSSTLGDELVMTLAGDGNIGIGTSSPDARLEVVNGNILVSNGNIVAKGSGTGAYNFVAGEGSGYYLTSGYNNVLIGEPAGASLTEGLNNILIGRNAGSNLVDEDENVLLGYNAGFSAPGLANSVGVGAFTLWDADNAIRTTAIGYMAGRKSNVTDGVYIGYDAGAYETESSKLWISNNNGALIEGSFADGWLEVLGELRVYGNNGITSNFIGGLGAGYAIASGEDNTFIGESSGADITIGTDNTFYGSNSGNFGSGGTESYNTLVGSRAGINAQGLMSSTGIGAGALEDAVNAWGTVAIGSRAGFNTTGADGVYIGANAGEDENISGKLWISNVFHNLIEGSFADEWVTVHGDLNVTGNQYFNGNVSIGEEVPGYKLSIVGEYPQIFIAESPVNWIEMGVTDTGMLEYRTDGVQYYVGGNGHFNVNDFIYYNSSTEHVGIGTMTPQNELNVIGNGNFTGNITVDSINVLSPNSITLAGVHFTRFNISYGPTFFTGVLVDDNYGVRMNKSGSATLSVINYDASENSNSIISASNNERKSVSTYKFSSNHNLPNLGAIYSNDGRLKIIGQKDSNDSLSGIDFSFIDGPILSSEFQVEGFANETIIMSLFNDSVTIIPSLTITNGSIMAYGPSGKSTNHVAGERAGMLMTNGFGNVLAGYEAGRELTDEDKNTFVGYKAGEGSTGGNNLIGLGPYAMLNSNGAHRTIGIGTYAGEGATCMDCVFIGYEQGKNSFEDDKLFIGNVLGTLIEGDFANDWLKVFGDLEVTGSLNVTNGNINAYGAGGDDSNFVAGKNAGTNLGAGAVANVVIGYDAGNGIINEDGNVFIGFKAGEFADGSANSVAIGEYSMLNADGADRVVALGGFAGDSATSNDGVYIGYKAGYQENTPSKFWLSNNDGNLMEGSFADEWLHVYGDLSVEPGFSLGIGTDNPNAKLDINGTGITTGEAMRINVNSLTTGKALHIYSDAPSIDVRTLLDIHNDNTAAIGTIPLAIQQDANTEAFEINAMGVTTDDAMKLILNSLTTGTGFEIYSNAANADVRSLLYLHNDNPSAVEAMPLRIKQDAPDRTALQIDSGNLLMNDGSLEIYTGDILVYSGGDIFLDDGGEMRLDNGAHLNVNNGGDVNINGGDLVVTGGSFTMPGSTGMMILPRRTTTYRDSITPTNGMIFYSTTNNRVECFENNFWVGCGA